MPEYHDAIKNYYSDKGGMKEFTGVKVEDAAFDFMGVKAGHKPKIRKAIKLHRAEIKKGQDEMPRTKGAQLDFLLSFEAIRTHGDSGELDEEESKQVAVFCMDFRETIIENPNLNLIRKVHIPDELWIGGRPEVADLKLL